MRRPLGTGQRLVVKVGSSSLVDRDLRLDPAAITRVAGQVAESWANGFPTVLVSSGAVAAGLSSLRLDRRPQDMPSLQAAAAVGQVRLMHRYAEAFAENGLIAGQILLTRDVLANREQYLHARQTLDRMLAQGIVPVVNENDTVVIDELRLGDNDRLAAIVSHLVGAGLLVLLTDTEGLFSSDPRLGEADFMDAVDHTDRRLDTLTGSGPLGRGGVASKVEAARIAAFSRVPTVIAGASSKLAEVVAGADIGTWIEPRPTALPARKLWIAFCQPVTGAITVDAGAAAALAGGGSSLLPIGVTGVSGTFARGETVDVLDAGGSVIARGLVRLGAYDLSARIGVRGGEEAIHRDDLVVF